MKWAISIISSLVIWAVLGGLYFYWNEEIPVQLPERSSLTANSEQADVEDLDEPKELKDIIKQVQDVVVMIQLENGSLGSGFLYNERGDVITNAHVVMGAETVTVKTADASEYEGTVIGISDEIDVAVVRVPGLKDKKPLQLSEKKAELGEEIIALGSPLGYQNTVTTGIISGIGRNFEIGTFRYSDAYQISAPIAPGNSGGPLVNKNTGEVVGINSAVIEEGSIGFSIPITNVSAMVKEWSASPMTELPVFDLYDGNDTQQQSALEESALYLISYFYESINIADYETAYSLLGSEWQNKLSLEDFKAGYSNTVSVEIDQLMITDSTKEKMTAFGIITAKEAKGGTSKLAKYKIEYKVGFENGEMKILQGKGDGIEIPQ
ncbi:trypsin-like peptidase domain-containing protein [Bacillus sp. AGMB 02131]|uniref:Trypsin-like peptidase domain-containing protein n=1 Tax=Peribacillus faecalis TaxID=2772559 RepID=A0A927CXM1_9BACI|nr:trypsin-like peptidase domain-containing protein [Peribacillus faecalis]MBD3109528.1 trypsin-like peptidase domain-containing protein [Peribacillus faecalis]